MSAIISKDTIRARARRDFEQGKGRDEHGFNWHALCLPAYLDEFDRLESQQSHGAPAARRHVDARQVEVV